MTYTFNAKLYIKIKHACKYVTGKYFKYFKTVLKL